MNFRPTNIEKGEGGKFSLFKLIGPIIMSLIVASFVIQYPLMVASGVKCNAFPLKMPSTSGFARKSTTKTIQSMARHLPLPYKNYILPPRIWEARDQLSDQGFCCSGRATGVEIIKPWE